MTVPTVLGVGPNSFKPNELITFSLSLGSEKKSLRKSEMIKDFFFFVTAEKKDTGWYLLKGKWRAEGNKIRR